MKHYVMRLLGILLLLFPLMSHSQTTDLSIPQLLDANKDGIIDPYEALDVLLLLQKENKAPLETQKLKQIAQEHQKEQEAEIIEMFEELDKNKDGKIKVQEVNKSMRDMVFMMDLNGDKSVELSEAANFNIEDQMLLDDETINNWCDYLFKKQKTSSIPIKELKEEFQEFVEADVNEDQKITKEEVFQMLKVDNTPASFRVEGDVAFMNGVICSTTPAKVLELLVEHPTVHTIEMGQVPGSIDDIANLRAALYLHKAGLTTRLTLKSKIASGGTDFFLAGQTRIVKQGAQIGVHSWGGMEEKATDLSKDDEAHQKYLDYYKTVDIPAEFYWYTLEAAPAESIHWMTEEAIKTYKIHKPL